MGDPRGFLKHGREGQPRRPVDERRRDWREAYGELPTPKLQAQASRCMDCGVPFCHPGCPLGNLIPEFNDLAWRDRWREALDRLHATNNFPEFTGRLCPAPCEAACVLGINQDPVTIKAVEQAIVDRGFAEGWIRPQPPAARTGRTVAVVGSGPAGLAAAQQLNRAGHHVTVFERADRAGGLLRYGIPDFKLEKWVLDRRLRLMEEEGVAFRNGVSVGGDLSAEELRARFDAVLVATGATVPRDLDLPGRGLSGIVHAMVYLEQQNRAVAGDDAGDAAPITAAGKRVVILGGGDTGADCLGTAHRQGARSVHQVELMPRPGEERPSHTPWPRWPAILRSSAAHEEGGVREWAVRTSAFLGDGEGHVTGLEAVRLEHGPAGTDGRTPVVSEGESFRLDADLVLLALGFVSPDPSVLASFGVQPDARGNVRTDAAYHSSVQGVFAAGDARRGQSLIVWAIREGREAARAIDRWLTGTTHLPLAGARSL